MAATIRSCSASGGTGQLDRCQVSFRDRLAYVALRGTFAGY